MTRCNSESLQISLNATQNTILLELFPTFLKIIPTLHARRRVIVPNMELRYNIEHRNISVSK